VASLADIYASRNRWIQVIDDPAAAADAGIEALHGCRAAVIQLEAQFRSLGYPVHDFVRPPPPDLETRSARVVAATGI
jgi:hypothetical protein